jgi:hypothetical protein
MCEISYARVVVACFENIFIWDLGTQALVNKLPGSDDIIKKVITCLSGNTKEHFNSEVIACIDLSGVLNIWDGENIKS